MARKTRTPRYVLFPLRCLICGESFHPTRLDARFCGTTCRKRFSRAKVAGDGRDPTRVPVTAKGAKRKAASRAATA
jgi:hypothetical protein